MSQDTILISTQFTPEYAAEQIRAILPRHPTYKHPARGEGYWLGFGIIGRVETPAILNKKIHLDIVGLRRGGNDPTLDSVEGEVSVMQKFPSEDGEIELPIVTQTQQIGVMGLYGKDLRRAATITLQATGIMTVIFFEICDSELTPLFREIAKQIEPRAETKQDTNRIGTNGDKNMAVLDLNALAKEYGDVIELTWGECKKLMKKRAQGDAHARQRLDDYGRAAGYEDFDAYWKGMIELISNIGEYIDLAAGEAAGCNGKLTEDPVARMIMLRHKQPEIINDPYLGYVLEQMENVPIVETVKQVRTRMTTNPILIAPAPNEQSTYSGNGIKRTGRRPDYDFETMALAVIAWRALQAQPRQATDLDADDMLDDAPAKRMTKIEFLANQFSNGDVNELAVSTRKFDRWAQQFDKGAWEIPKKHKKRYEKLKADKKEL